MKLKQYKPQVIDSFSGDYRWLSNFELVEIDTGNHYGKFPSVEVAYQAMKSKDPEVHDLMRHMDPGHAKRYGQKQIDLREDWDLVKLIYMGWFCWRKFSTNEELKAKLFATKDAILIEGNNWNDTYWGVCNGKGENHLGIILMGIRDDLKEGANLNNIHFRLLLNEFTS